MVGKASTGTSFRPDRQYAGGARVKRVANTARDEGDLDSANVASILVEGIVWQMELRCNGENDKNVQDVLIGILKNLGKGIGLGEGVAVDSRDAATNEKRNCKLLILIDLCTDPGNRWLGSQLTLAMDHGRNMTQKVIALCRNATVGVAFEQERLEVDPRERAVKTMLVEPGFSGAGFTTKGVTDAIRYLICESDAFFLSKEAETGGSWLPWAFFPIAPERMDTGLPLNPVLPTSIVALWQAFQNGKQRFHFFACSRHEPDVLAPLIRAWHWGRYCRPPSVNADSIQQLTLAADTVGAALRNRLFKVYQSPGGPQFGVALRGDVDAVLLDACEVLRRELVQENADGRALARFLKDGVWVDSDTGDERQFSGVCVACGVDRRFLALGDALTGPPINVDEDQLTNLFSIDARPPLRLVFFWDVTLNAGHVELHLFDENIGDYVGIVKGVSEKTISWDATKRGWNLFLATVFAIAVTEGKQPGIKIEFDDLAYCYDLLAEFAKDQPFDLRGGPFQDAFITPLRDATRSSNKSRSAVNAPAINVTLSDKGTVLHIKIGDIDVGFEQVTMKLHEFDKWPSEAKSFQSCIQHLTNEIYRANEKRVIAIRGGR